MSRQRVFLVLALPILALMLLVGHKAYRSHSGTEITLPVEGFDPRDLLAGHFIQYRVDYGVPVCAHSEKDKPNVEWKATVCLEPPAFIYGITPPEPCGLHLAGICRHGRFIAGIERFYIPETEAGQLDAAVRAKRGAIRVHVGGDGKGVVTELLLDGKPWQEALREK
ncbi:MAG: GDYXXLXY domain-containing protein [Magnetococcales bacterium]|nr:GDYXXLXY domain-containing protein [Magnetococcales bacterium]